MNKYDASRSCFEIKPRVANTHPTDARAIARTAVWMAVILLALMFVLQWTDFLQNGRKTLYLNATTVHFYTAL